MSDATRLLRSAAAGDPHAAAELLPLIYEELRKLAAQRLGQEKPGQTLQATALVHEAYLRLVDQDQTRRWDGRGHFFAAAAEAMRRILIDSARRRRSIKGGGDRRRADLADVEPVIDPPEPVDLLALDEALSKLQAKDPRQAEVVKLRFFAGLGIEETARAMGISASTVDNEWAHARAWLRLEMDRDRTPTR